MGMRDDDPAPLDDEHEPPPELVAPLAASCIDYVRSAVGVELDLTGDTLPLLDHYLAGARGEIEARPELLPLLARAVGAYFGEVVRRDMDAFWYLPSEDVAGGRICFARVFLAVSPVAAAYDALCLGTNHDGPSSELVLLPHERQLVFQRLALLPEVAEEEYYSFSTRLEVLQIANEALLAEMHRAEVGSTLYDAADYASELERGV